MLVSSASVAHSPVLARPPVEAAQNAAQTKVAPAILPEKETVQSITGQQPVKEGNGSVLSMSNELFSSLQEGANDTAPSADKAANREEAKSSSPEESELGLSPEEEAQVASLKKRDREVRSHEQAHAAAGGQHAGAPSYEYQNGPNNQRYAVGGEVKIDTAPVAGDPAATIAKMDTVIKAALAPAEPSAQDKSVAAAASQKRIEAQAALTAERQQTLSGDNEDGAKIGDVSDTSQKNDADAAPSTVDPSAITNLFA